MSEKGLQQNVDELMGAIGLLVRRVRAESDAGDLSMTENAVLARLMRGGPATTADLARAERVKPQSMGTLITALLEEGLVTRQPHPTDGRQMLVEITPKGIEARNTHRAAKVHWVTEHVAKLRPEEQERLFAATSLLRQLGER